ncbi:hypothetical protein GRF29_69g57395 [Pseudopithomyces chartarum]|uniref:Uncharacterized protein n=1 Tax=Pseudopithomyces chartarum TaxID=1892770 RepID=A0AAN6LY32_9PLEO|nr:hypothetical protein GRF29_69g57395 [Pseudopithomyces chartarum]
MHFPLLTTTLTLPPPLVAADFNLYKVNADTWWDSEHGFEVYASDPDCKRQVSWYGFKNDVSGETLGARCEGVGCQQNSVCIFDGWKEGDGRRMGVR